MYIQYNVSGTLSFSWRAKKRWQITGGHRARARERERGRDGEREGGRERGREMDETPPIQASIVLDP